MKTTRNRMGALLALLILLAIQNAGLAEIKDYLPPTLKTVCSPERYGGHRNGMEVILELGGQELLRITDPRKAELNDWYAVDSVRYALTTPAGAALVTTTPLTTRSTTTEDHLTTFRLTPQDKMQTYSMVRESDISYYKFLMGFTQQACGRQVALSLFFPADYHVSYTKSQTVAGSYEIVLFNDAARRWPKCPRPWFRNSVPQTCDMLLAIEQEDHLMQDTFRVWLPYAGEGFDPRRWTKGKEK